jgi:hypothetical protein
VEILGHHSLGEGSVELGPIIQTALPNFGQFHPIPPLGAARAGTCKKFIDLNSVANSSLRHLILRATRALRPAKSPERPTLLTRLLPNGEKVVELSPVIESLLRTRSTRH